VRATKDTGSCEDLPVPVAIPTTPIVISSAEVSFIYIYPSPAVIENSDSSSSQVYNAMLTDTYGNPVEDGTAVIFSIEDAMAGESVCPEGFTGVATDADDCVGETTAMKGVARTKLTWASDLEGLSFTLTATSGEVDASYEGFYPADPTADFEFAGDPLVNFTSTSETPGDTEIISCEWDFGDSSSDNSSCGVSHTYAANDTYTVTLTVTNNTGGQDTISKNVIISSFAP
jgi:PKD repeat protein